MLSSTFMRVSFCTTCRSRRHDLEKTLAANLLRLRRDEELVLLDYNSPDGLRDWVIRNFSGPLSTGRLHLYSEKTAERYFSSHAKNVSHILSSGDVIVNLDADNFLDANYLSSIRNADWKKVGAMFPMKSAGGCKGRLAIRRDIFLAFGGYNEEFRFGYGYDDLDFYRRLAASPDRLVAAVNVDRAMTIPTAYKDQCCWNIDNLTGEQSTARHKAMCEAALRNGELVCNTLRPWGCAEVYDHNGDIHMTCRSPGDEPMLVDDET